MAQRHGKAGSLTWNNGGAETQANMTAWSFAMTCDTPEATSMDNANDYKEFVIGFTDWTATVEIAVDSTNILLGTSTILGELGDSGVLVFNDGTGTFTGTAIALDCNVTTSIDDGVRATYTFQGTSKIA